MKTTGSLRAALAFTLALTCAAGAVRAQVAGYPDRPIKLLVGFGAGGGTDIVARLLARELIAQQCRATCSAANLLTKDEAGRIAKRTSLIQCPLSGVKRTLAAQTKYPLLTQSGPRHGPN